METVAVGVICMAIGIAIGRYWANWAIIRLLDTVELGKRPAQYSTTTIKTIPDVRCPACNAPCYMPRGEGGDWWCPNLKCTLPQPVRRREKS
jgi:hypothetical protein